MLQEIRAFIDQMDLELYTTREELEDDVICAMYNVVSNDLEMITEMVNRALDEMEAEHR